MKATKVEIKKSTRSGKKMMAVFYDGDKKVKTGIAAYKKKFGFK
jgi:hypothetical protein